ncbi:unnamed protein product [Didymodactylos carnosus]|uniref:HAT C-terminal dimerisation domain-containing protein n=1 Tax=Didymodactylos carnosus TaxID=1234261 RepID=A0A813XPJ1_9BILA|nr:unnamed protein product [Didymodactylos carnosus]CAF0952682.1 unnamed protein product [Didymodactylos carnosus]CAF3665752.1 unnamed protein product [Didymodactylos carnosus]CAF3726322.1 unnamed protein product [Didymodactylos carnosus]
MESSCGIQLNINENCSLSTTIITTTNDNKKRSVAHQLINVSELERQENRQRFGDLLDAAYFLLKYELPHTILYAPILELLSKIDHSKKLSIFFDKCQKNATYDSTTTHVKSLEPILEALSIFLKSIQTKNADFNQLEQSMLGTLLRLEELKDINIIEHKQIFEIVDKIKTSSPNNHNRNRITRSTTRRNEISLEELFDDKIVEFIDKIISNITAQFESNVLKFLNCFRIFDVSEKVFRKYLYAQKQQQLSTILTQRQQCNNLVKNGMTRDMYPQLSLAAEIFLCAPVSTATAERDFSTMNIILTDLRNRLTTEHLEQLMRIS